MLHVIQTFGDELPAACQNSCDSAWSIFDSFLAKFGSDYDLCERTTRVLRHGLSLFGNAALPVAASVMSRLTGDFETTGFPSNLWIAGKIIQRFGNEEDLRLRSSFQEVYERSTQKIITMLQAKTPGEIPDGALLFIDEFRSLISIFYFLQFSKTIYTCCCSWSNWHQTSSSSLLHSPLPSVHQWRLSPLFTLTSYLDL